MRSHKTLILLWVAILFLVGDAAWAATGDPAAHRPIELHEQGYVASASCQSCHARQYETWHASFHRTMTQSPTAETVRGDFNNAVVQAEGHTYRFEKRGDEYWVEMDEFWHAPAAGEKYVRSWQRLSLITGSHSMQVYWFANGNGRQLEQLPVVYLFAAQRWVPRRDIFLGPPDVPEPVVTGRWNDTCIRCHTTHGQPRVSADGRADTHVAEFGIACEACHGAGEKHAALQQQIKLGKISEASAKDQFITHPDKISPVRASEICGQCHSVSTQNRKDWQKWLAHGSDFHPGDELKPYLEVLQFKDKDAVAYWQRTDLSFLRNRFWSDGMIRVSGREFNGLVDSPCFSKGKGDRQLSCLSCHTLHQPATDARPRAEWANYQLKAHMESNAGCTQCHEQINQNLAAHTHHAANSAGSQCYNCHMPYTTYGLLRAMRSHQVSSPTVQASLATGRPNACNQCHLDKTLAWTSDRLNQWYGTAKPTLSTDEQNIAASVLWTLKGDAGQRALMAWSMGWKDALAVSGTDWEAPYLAPLLDDPYGAVRFIAQQSLHRLPGYENFTYDYVGAPEQRRLGAAQVMGQWQQRGQGSKVHNPSALLIDQNGRLQQSIFLQLLNQRDERRIVLSE